MARDRLHERREEQGSRLRAGYLRAALVAEWRRPPHHQDPIDRLLIAQARLEGLCLLSSDRALKIYSRSVVLL